MQCVAKRYFKAGPFVRLEDVPGKPDLIRIVFGLPDEIHEVCITRDGEVPVEGQIVVDGPLDVQFISHDEFHEHFTEI